MAEPIAADQLRSFVERIERLEEEKAVLAGDIREVYAEAKGNGFDTKALRKIIALRKLDYAERREQEAILALYMEALGMLADTPLGKAAIARVREERDPKVSIEFAGHPPIETTASGLRRTAARLKTPAGRRAMRRAAATARDAEALARDTGL